MDEDNPSCQVVMKRFVQNIWNAIYQGSLLTFYPMNLALSMLLRNRKHANSVLHISYMVHVPSHTVQLLRKIGVKADYLAIGISPTWDKCDIQLIPSRWPHIRALQEFVLFWKVVAKYEILHSHFAVLLSTSGWELPILKRMGRKLVIHYRGC